MRRWVHAAGIALVIAGAAGYFGQARAEEAGTPGDEPYPVKLKAGEIFSVCKSGQIICPAVAPICDDPKVADPVDTPDGLGFRGIGPGTTLCSAGTAAGLRRVFRITVE